MSALARLVAHLSFVLLSGCYACDGTRSTELERKKLDARFVAHAFGGFEAKTYLNCKECFEFNYQKGFRHFEVDFWMASDGELVAFHDGAEKRFGLSQGFSSKEFLTSRLEGTTPLDARGVVELMREKPDWVLVTDIKTSNEAGMDALVNLAKAAGVDYRERIVPQIYFPSEIRMLKKHGFRRSIFTLYRFGNKKQSVFSFVRKNPEISAVTLPASWFDEDYRAKLKMMNVPVFVHTLNEPGEISRVFALGADGVYTDFFFQ